jgi:hypothetical protein
VQRGEIGIGHVLRRPKDSRAVLAMPAVHDGPQARQQRRRYLQRVSSRSAPFAVVAHTFQILVLSFCARFQGYERPLNITIPGPHEGANSAQGLNGETRVIEQQVYKHEDGL